MVSTTHRVAAWNTLCALIDRCSISSNVAVRELIWRAGVWGKTFGLFLNRSQEARPKAAKQLLATLSSSLTKNPDKLAARGVRVHDLCRLLIIEDDHSRTKAALHVLAHFLSKGIIELPSVLDVLAKIQHRAPSEDLHIEAQHLIGILLDWGSVEDFGSIVGRTISTVLDKASGQTGCQSLVDDVGSFDREAPIWSQPLAEALQDDRVRVDRLRNHVFPVLFKRNTAQYLAFLHQQGLENFAEGTLFEKRSIVDGNSFLAVLQAGKELGLVYEASQITTSREEESLLVPINAIGQLMILNDRNARLAGLSLLIDCHATTRPFHRQVFALLRSYLSDYFTDTDANFRSEVFCAMQRLVDRMRSITAVLAREPVGKQRSGSSITSLQEYQAMIEWLLHMVGMELRPTANYQRHISALKILTILLRSGIDDSVPRVHRSKSATAQTTWPFHLSIFDTGLTRVLMDLLLDPFDDVRHAAASILSVFIQTNVKADRATVHAETERALARSEAVMMMSGRADHADGVAHIYSLLHQSRDAEGSSSRGCRYGTNPVALSLLDKLEDMLVLAKQHLLTAATKHPVHGVLTSLRYVVLQQSAEETLSPLFPRLAACLRSVWDIVSPILCDDAPEGYAGDEEDELSDSSSKDVLSYCWRALKESSLFLGALLTFRSLPESEASDLADLCFTQLAELRHRGAFSTVARTWVACCVRCKDFQSQGESTNLEGWYRRVLGLLENKTTINTRRSAGIPSVLCGILIADKSRRFVDRAFEDLTVIARIPVDDKTAHQSSLPQAHAMNCIKEMLKSTALGGCSERQVPQALALAADSLRSEAWAVRNCGLMLFRAVIDRLLGTSDAHLEDDNAPVKRSSSLQHPDLLLIVLDLLKVDQHQQAVTTVAERQAGVFPALHLVQRMSLDAVVLGEVKNAVLELTANVSWHVRDKAARTYVTLCAPADQREEVTKVLQSASVGRQNRLHGALLVTKYFLRSMRGHRQGSTASLPPHEEKASCPLVQQLTSPSLVNQLYKKNPCLYTKAAFLDLLIEGPPEALLDVDTLLFELQQCTWCTPNFQGSRSMLRRSLARAVATALSHSQPKLHSNEVSDIICTLGREDVDACEAFFESLRVDDQVDDGKISILANVSLHMLSGPFDSRLKCEVQRFLLRLADRNDVFTAFLSACASAAPLYNHQTTQCYADQGLQLHGAALACRLRTSPSQAEHDGALLTLLKTCNEAITTDTSLFSREAAARTLARVPLPPFPDVHLALHALLNDDDEDLRTVAIHAATRLYPRPTRTPLFPPNSQQTLLASLPSSPFWTTTALTRAFPLPPTPPRPPTQQHHAHVLFAEEPSNQYLDPVLDTRLWANHLLATASAPTPVQLRELRSACLARLSHRAPSPSPMTVKHDFLATFRAVRGVEIVLRWWPAHRVAEMEAMREALTACETRETETGNVLLAWEAARVLGRK